MSDNDRRIHGTVNLGSGTFWICFWLLWIAAELDSIGDALHEIASKLP